jgi:hypothetical protein
MRLFCTALLTLALAGCRSPYIEATISNRTPTPITLVELDYPSASFGTQNLAPGADYHYRFQIIGSGPTKLLYTDATHKDHSSPGPTLAEGAQGDLTILITPTAVRWQPGPTLKTEPTPQP